MNAIILAAGKGERLRPLTYSTPKPLIKPSEESFIDTLIQRLLKRGVNNITIVVGYLKEKFYYLSEKYPKIHFVENDEYENYNNLYSLYVANDVLSDDCFICEADLYASAENLFDIPLDTSVYYGVKQDAFSNDWGLKIAENGRLLSIKPSGNNDFKMCGISFFKKDDAITLQTLIKEACGKDLMINKNKFWDEIVDSNLDKFDIHVNEIHDGDVVEIDTVDELSELVRQLDEGR